VDNETMRQAEDDAAPALLDVRRKPMKGDGIATSGMLPDHLSEVDWGEIQRLQSVVVSIQERVRETERKAMEEVAAQVAALHRTEGMFSYVIDAMRSKYGMSERDGVDAEGRIVRPSAVV